MTTNNASHTTVLSFLSPWKGLLLLAVAAASAAMAGEAHGQRFDPFIDPTHFDSDFQYFAPAEVDTYGGAPDPNTGFFFTYDRMYVNMTRPRDVASHFEGDFTWGNRYDMGFMTEDDHGWLLSIMHVDGPNLEDLNHADYSSVELNRVWRLKQLHNGSYVEPFIGVRYIKFIDSLDLQNQVENNIVGGQIGARWFKQKGRWLLSAEGRLTPAVNFQFFNTEDQNEFAMQGEVRADAKYEITRDVGVRVGYQFTHFGQGIARGIDFGNNSEDLSMNAITFGIDWKR